MIIPLLKNLVKDLTQENYDLIEKSGRIQGVNAKDIEYGINRYKKSFLEGKVSFPPDSSFFNFNKYDYENDPNKCLIEFDLWIDNEKSDIMLKAEVTKEIIGKYKICIQDILVM